VTYGTCEIKIGMLERIDVRGCDGQKDKSNINYAKLRKYDK
jgi:hypothetical protein